MGLKASTGTEELPKWQIFCSGAGIEIRPKLSRARWKKWACVLRRRLIRCSGVSKVNPVYGKTRVKSDFTWSRDAKSLLYIYIYIYRSSGAAKVNPVYGKTRVISEFTWSRDAKVKKKNLSLLRHLHSTTMEIDIWVLLLTVLYLDYEDIYYYC
jgi:hypothetical protein